MLNVVGKLEKIKPKLVLSGISNEEKERIIQARNLFKKIFKNLEKNRDELEKVENTMENLSPNIADSTFNYIKDNINEKLKEIEASYDYDLDLLPNNDLPSLNNLKNSFESFYNPNIFSNIEELETLANSFGGKNSSSTEGRNNLSAESEGPSPEENKPEDRFEEELVALIGENGEVNQASVASGNPINNMTQDLTNNESVESPDISQGSLMGNERTNNGNANRTNNGDANRTNNGMLNFLNDFQFNSADLNNFSKQAKDIVVNLVEIIKKISGGDVNESNRSEVDQKLELLHSMIKILEKRQGENNNTKFLKKLLVSSQLQMNKLVENKLGSDKHLQPPQLPTISQFKPQGSSNIFSPYIDIKTSSAQDNKRFLEAYEKGFDKGYGEKSELKLGDINIDRKETYDFSSQTGDISTIDNSFKNVSKQDMTLGVGINMDQNTRFGDDVTMISGQNLNQKNNVNNRNNNRNHSNQNHNNRNNMNNRSSNEVNNGYVKGNNQGKLGMPGYSYIDPQLWEIPKKRHPVCINTPEGKRKPSSLLPSGYMTGGNADLMEFTGVGSILPKFTFQENTQSVPDETKRI